MIVDIEDDIMDPVMQCTTLPSHSSFSQKKLVSFVTEIHTLSIDISLRDCYGHFCHFDFFGLFRGERRTSTALVILFGMIPTAIPATVPIVDPPIVHDDTLLIPTETPTIPPVVSTLPHTSPFLYTDSSDSDTSKRPLLQDSYKVTVARWRSRVAARSSPPTRQILPTPPGLPRRPAILILPGQPIPVG
ncbi:hypothetical protein Tco_0250499 [Tanacetum coccineum]